MTNSSSFISCLEKRSLCLPLSVIFPAFLVFQCGGRPSPTSCNFSEALRLEAAPSGDLERKGHFLSPSSLIIMFII